MIAMKEIWKDVLGYEGVYKVSNWGRVWSVRKKILMKLHDNGTGKGYKYIWGYKDGNREKLYIHIIVAQAFIPNPKNLPEVNHKDENPANNCVDNLEWCTHQYNSAYSNNKAIEMLTIDWKHEAYYESMQQTEMEVGVLWQSVSACCRGRYKYAIGRDGVKHRFRYKESQAS